MEQQLVAELGTSPKRLLMHLQCNTCRIIHSSCKCFQTSPLRNQSQNPTGPIESKDTATPSTETRHAQLRTKDKKLHESTKPQTGSRTVQTSWKTVPSTSTRVQQTCMDDKFKQVPTVEQLFQKHAQKFKTKNNCLNYNNNNNNKL